MVFCFEPCTHQLDAFFNSITPTIVIFRATASRLLCLICEHCRREDEANLPSVAFLDQLGHGSHEISFSGCRVSPLVQKTVLACRQSIASVFNYSGGFAYDIRLEHVFR
jgi:hypothetical protein